jgi:hypothetical protein
MSSETEGLDLQPTKRRFILSGATENYDPNVSLSNDF